jgi:hypothetical protein
MSYGGLAFAVICLAVAVIFFIRWNIPKVMGDVTGTNQKKTIEKIRRDGYEASASKQSYSGSETNSGTIRVRKTDTDELSKLQDEEDEIAANEEETAVLSEGGASEAETAVLSGGRASEAETAVLSGGGASEAETAVLSGGGASEAETAVLSGGGANEAETAVLTESDNSSIDVIHLPAETYTPEGTVQQILELIITHTSEVVE